MKNPVHFSVRSLVVATVVMAPFSASLAALDTFAPYAYTRVVHDTNLFRVSGDQEAIAILGDDKKDDTIGYIGAGVKSDLKLSRQHLLFDADIAAVRYDHFSDLDHTQAKGDATWAWQVGNLWSGNLGYRYNRRLRSFNEDQTPKKDIRTAQTGYFDGGYQISPDWSLNAGLDHADISYDDRKSLDRTATTGYLEALYRNTLNSRVGVRGRYTDYDLQNDLDLGGQVINNDYDEQEISGVIYWEGTGKSSLEARLGYTTLNYNDSSLSDFNGTSGRLTYYWAVTGKTRLEIAMWRETSSKDSEISSYVIAQGASIKPVWSVTPKVSLRGIVSFTNDDYKGENDVRNALGLERRDDDTWLYGISANWRPRDFLRFSIGYRRQDRDSSIDLNDYDDNRVNAEVNFTF